MGFDRDKLEARRRVVFGFSIGANVFAQATNLTVVGLNLWLHQWTRAGVVAGIWMLLVYSLLESLNRERKFLLTIENIQLQLEGSRHMIAKLKETEQLVHQMIGPTPKADIN